MKSFARARQWALPLLLAYLALGLCDYGLAVSPVLEWTAQIGSVGDGNVTGVALDGRGNVFVTGFANWQLGDAWPDGTDFFVARYSDSGERVWTQQFRAPGDNYARGIAADPLGNVFVAGASSINLLEGGPGLVDGGEPYRSGFLTKFNDQGETAWTVDVPHSSLDAILVDEFGDVLVTGYHDYTYGDFGEGDVLLSKYSSDGALLWTSSLESTGRWFPSHDSALAVTADQLGNIFVGGYTEGKLVEEAENNDGAFIAHFDREGHHIWTRQFGKDGDDKVQAIAADGYGNVYVTGYLGGRDGAFLAKFNSVGEAAWIREVDEANLSWKKYVKGITVDTEGNLYLSKTITVSSDGNVEHEVMLSKYDTDGHLIWDHSTGISGSESSSGVALDGLGNVYLAANTYARHGVSQFFSYDAFVTKIHDPTASIHVVPEPRSLLIVGLLVVAMKGRARLRVVS